MSELFNNEQNENKEVKNIPLNNTEEPQALVNGSPANPQDASPRQNVSQSDNADSQTNIPFTHSPQNQQYQPQPPYGQSGPQYGQYIYGAPVYGQPPYSAPYAQSYDKPKKQPREKKPHARVPLAAVAVICAVTVVLSAFAGFGGAMLARNAAPDIRSGTTNGSPASSSSYSENDAGVIYRSVNTTSPSATGTATIPDVVEAVKNSVVEITTEYQTMSNWFQYVTEGAGSGVIITSDGYIVTNNHVITGSTSNSVADTIKVRTANGDEYDATVVGTDSDSDIALLKINAANLTPAVFGNSDNIIVGETVVAVGNPLGELGGTVTHGIISALNREIEVDSNRLNLLQFDAAVNPGNSGGGLFNLNGELVGIVNAKSSGSGIEGLGFAIPSNSANNIIEQLKQYGYVRGRVFIGITPLEITDYMTAMQYRVNSLGVYILSVEEGYNDKVLKVGDRIAAIDDTEISSRADIKAVLAKHNVGDVLKFQIARDGKLITVDVTCFEAKPNNVSDVEFDN